MIRKEIHDKHEIILIHPVFKAFYICRSIVQTNLSCGKISIMANNAFNSQLNEGIFGLFT